jgi:hypothetical protein
VHLKFRGDVFFFSDGAPRLSERSGKLRTLYRLEQPLLLKNPAIKNIWRMTPRGKKIKPAMSKLEACLHFFGRGWS